MDEWERVDFEDPGDAENDGVLVAPALAKPGGAPATRGGPKSEIVPRPTDDESARPARAAPRALAPGPDGAALEIDAARARGGGGGGACAPPPAL